MARDDSKQYVADVSRESLVYASSMVVPPRLGDPLVMSYLATSYAVSVVDKDRCESTSSGNIISGAYVKTGMKMSQSLVRERIVE